MSENNAARRTSARRFRPRRGLEFLSNMVSNLLSNDDYNIVIRYRPKSELTSDEVDFGLSKSLINNRLFVEVEGNYLIDNKQAINSSMSNFMGEAYITYLIDRRERSRPRPLRRPSTVSTRIRVFRRPASASTSRRISTTSATCGGASGNVSPTRSARPGAKRAARPPAGKRSFGVRRRIRCRPCRYVKHEKDVSAP